MRILFPYTGDTIGGSHWSSFELIKVLITNGVLVDIVLHKENDKISQILKNLSLPYIVLPANSILSIGRKKSLIKFLLGDLWLLVVFVIKNKYEIIHTNDNRIHLAWAIVAKIAGIKQILHLRNSHLPHFKVWKRIQNFPSGYIYLSDFNGKDLMSRNLIKVKIPNPITIPFNIQKKKLGDRINVGFVGNIEPRKRFDLFSEICVKLNKINGCNFQFNVFGTLGSQNKDDILKLIPNLKFFDFVTDVSFIYQNIDILICTAENEPLGRTVLEAMAFKVPVVASNSGAFTKLLQDDRGYIAISNKPDEFVDLVFEIINKWESLDLKLDENLNFVKEAYSPSKSSQSVIQFYNLILYKS